jgi:hypothetical protein
MSKPLKLTHLQWEAIAARIKEEYPPSIFIQSKMKSKLGFTKRIFYNEETYYDTNGDRRKKYLGTDIMLDFYSEKKRTFFLLKYSDIVNDVTHRTWISWVNFP